MKARGHNFFIPIPFQKSIRVVGGKDWGHYYQISYTQFPKDTKIPSFTNMFNNEERAALQRANDLWGRRGPKLFIAEDAQEKSVQMTLKPGEEQQIADFKQSGAISSIIMQRPLIERESSVVTLRQLSISITWDNDKAPAVWAPLGDFFGTGAGENLYASMMTGMTKDSYYANWYMPYERARVVIRNDDKTEHTLNFSIHTEQVQGDVAALLRYHCKWHRDDFSGFNREQLEGERWPDWPVLKVDGAAGRFCGFQAHMWNPFHLWNDGHKLSYQKAFPQGDAFKPGGSKYQFYIQEVAKHFWWGEGDEKFFVDGEKMPSTFGTGSEDYFGFAWGRSEAYDSALQAQPRNGAADKIGSVADKNGPGNIGHITMLRWQIADNIPFQHSFEAVIEKYHPNAWPLLNAYAASWYQTAGTTDYYKAVPPSERSSYFVDANKRVPPLIVDGKYEAEIEDHVRAAGHGFTIQGMAGFGSGWSNDAQLLWRADKEGAELILSFITKEPWKGLRLLLTAANDYGCFDFYLDGKRVGNTVDLYDPNVVVAPEIRVDNLKIAAGEHQLKVRCVGKDEKSSGLLFGIDYLQVIN